MDLILIILVVLGGGVLIAPLALHRWRDEADPAWHQTGRHLPFFASTHVEGGDINATGGWSDADSGGWSGGDPGGGSWSNGGSSTGNSGGFSGGDGGGGGRW